MFTAEGIHGKISFDLGCRLAEDIRHNSALREQIARSGGIEQTVLSENDKALSGEVAVSAVSSLADNLRVLLGKTHRKAGYGKSAHPVLRGGEIFLPILQLTNRYI